MSTNKILPSYYGYVGSTKDALLIIQEILNKNLDLVSRRPHERERSHLIKSGNVFVFIEEHSGIKRWTDGIAWSPSRILGRFLVYRELDKQTLNDKDYNDKKKKKRKTSLSNECVNNVVNHNFLKGNNNVSITNAVNNNNHYYNDNNSKIIPSAQNLITQDLNSNLLASATSSLSRNSQPSIPLSQHQQQQQQNELPSISRPSSSSSSTTVPYFNSSSSSIIPPNTIPASNTYSSSDYNRNLLSGPLVISYVFKDQGLIKKTVSLTTTTKDLHLEKTSGKQTIHLISYYNAEDVMNGKLHRPSEADLKNVDISIGLWNAVKDSSLGGKIPIEDEAFYFLDGNYQLQNMSLLQSNQQNTTNEKQNHHLHHQHNNTQSNFNSHDDKGSTTDNPQSSSSNHQSKYQQQQQQLNQMLPLPSTQQLQQQAHHQQFSSSSNQQEYNTKRENETNQELSFNNPFSNNHQSTSTNYPNMQSQLIGGQYYNHQTRLQQLDQMNQINQQNLNHLYANQQQQDAYQPHTYSQYPPQGLFPPYHLSSASFIHNSYSNNNDNNGISINNSSTANSASVSSANSASYQSNNSGQNSLSLVPTISSTSSIGNTRKSSNVQDERDNSASSHTNSRFSTSSTNSNINNASGNWSTASNVAYSNPDYEAPQQQHYYHHTASYPPHQQQQHQQIIASGGHTMPPPQSSSTSGGYLGSHFGHLPNHYGPGGSIIPSSQTNSASVVNATNEESGGNSSQSYYSSS